MEGVPIWSNPLVDMAKRLGDSIGPVTADKIPKIIPFEPCEVPEQFAPLTEEDLEQLRARLASVETEAP